MKAIYLDHNATTPARLEVIETVAKAQAEGFANPASQHQVGQRARKVLEETRERIAALLGADLTCTQPDRLIFTSGGTESNNLAILGITAGFSGNTGIPLNQKIIISSIEHQSVIEPAEYLLEQGWRLDTLATSLNGVVCLDALESLLTPETRLVSVILANHETGVLQPIAEMARLCNAQNVPLHTDAMQAAGKLPLVPVDTLGATAGLSSSAGNTAGQASSGTRHLSSVGELSFRALGVAAMSIAAHKFCGPLGIGALILRHDVTLKPLMYGGHQQFGLRPGTESVPLTLGMLTALELAEKERVEYARRVNGLRLRFETGLRSGFPEIVIHGENAERLPNTINLAFPGIDGQVLLIALDVAGVACSAGSACSSVARELSPTLRAMGLPSDIVASSLRFSLGTTTTEADIDEAVTRILHVCKEIRG